MHKIFKNSKIQILETYDIKKYDFIELQHLKWTNVHFFFPWSYITIRLSCCAAGKNGF